MVDANVSPSTDLLGKVITDLQQNVKIVEGTKVSGTLKYVTGYTGFSGDPELQSGNYLVLHASADTGATIKAKLVGGVDDEKTLDSDGILVARITDSVTAVKFTASLNGKTDSFTYDLSMLGKESA